MNIERRLLLRVAGAVALVLALMAGAAFMGATLWPRVVRVEQHVIAAPVNAAPPGDGSDTLPGLIQRSCPAVVAIEQVDNAPAGHGNVAAAPGQDGPPRRMTGFFISADGYVATSARALSEQGPVRVLLNDGRSFDATRGGRDPVSGLALLKIDASGLTFLEFADARFPRVGEQGMALASPNGTGCVAAAGMISADFLAGQPGLWSYIEIRPVLEPDFIGAPFLNAGGRVVGIAGLGPPSADSADESRLLPAGIAARIASELLRNGNPAVNRAGIVADDLVPELAARAGIDRQGGAMVSLIREGSPAARAGLKAGDIVLSASGAPISGASELSRALDTNDRVISLDVLRRARRIILTLANNADSPR